MYMEISRIRVNTTQGTMGAMLGVCQVRGGGYQFNSMSHNMGVYVERWSRQRNMVLIASSTASNDDLHVFIGLKLSEENSYLVPVKNG